MAHQKSASILSVVIPVYNEADGLKELHYSLDAELKNSGSKGYEIIYCDDGSDDTSCEVISGLSKSNTSIKLIKLSRNFGKESALTAGIAYATGDAIITMDADGQHPVGLIKQFIDEWQAGAQVVVGIRTSNKGEGVVKRWGSKTFYSLYNKVTNQSLLPGSTDFRLIDRTVQREFLRMNETNRIARGLIDWLGFKRTYVEFEAAPRKHGEASYKVSGLVKLAVNTFVSLTPVPLYVFGYLGVAITAGSLLLGVSVLVEQILMGDPLSWNFTGTAMLGILILFLVGIILISQGILSLYVSHMHAQTMQRPVYVVDYNASIGVQDERD